MNRYEKSYMHRDVVTHVAVSAAEFVVTGSVDGEFSHGTLSDTFALVAMPQQESKFYNNLTGGYLVYAITRTAGLSHANPNTYHLLILAVFN